MGFIRQYADDSGDPFRLRRPRWMRKLPVGRLAGMAAHMVPGVGQGMDFARSFGLIAGDPGPRRKGAAAGPKAKAKAKAQHRANKHAKGAAAHGHAKGKRKGKAKGPTIDWNALGEAAAGAVPVVGGLASEVYRQVAANAAGGADQQDGATPIDSHPDFGTFGAPAHGGARAHGFGGHRRRTNPANVHALRRSIRRLESFEKLVRKVTPHLAALRGHAGGGGGHRKARGHKAGCRCAVCSRA